jgi:hypothetical protein
MDQPYFLKSTLDQKGVLGTLGNVDGINGKHGDIRGEAEEDHRRGQGEE